MIKRDGSKVKAPQSVIWVCGPRPICKLRTRWKRSVGCSADVLPGPDKDIRGTRGIEVKSRELLLFQFLCLCCIHSACRAFTFVLSFIHSWDHFSVFLPDTIHSCLARFSLYIPCFTFVQSQHPRACSFVFVSDARSVSLAYRSYFMKKILSVPSSVTYSILFPQQVGISFAFLSNLACFTSDRNIGRGGWSLRGLFKHRSKPSLPPHASMCCKKHARTRPRASRPPWLS